MKRQTHKSQDKQQDMEEDKKEEGLVRLPH